MAIVTATNPEVKATVATVEAGKRYSVAGSKGNWYTVLVNPNGSLACQCMAGQHSKHCRHIESVAGVLAMDNWQEFADRMNTAALQQWPELAPRLAQEEQAARRARAMADKNELNGVLS